MSKVHQLPDVAEAEQAASEWIARLHADDVTADDLARFEAWRAAHPRHARAYHEMSATIDEVQRAGLFVRAVSFGNAMNAASDPVRAGNRTPNARPAARLGAAAAAVIVAVTIASFWWVQRTVPQTLFQTAIGEHASIELPDGSTLELNSNSMARIDYTPRARTIRLTRGEAFFKVAHEAQRPFWVVAGGSWIRAVGTAFTVDLRPSGVRVIVSEGTVKVASAQAVDQPPSDMLLVRAPVSVLTAGQQAEVKHGAARIRDAEPLELTRVAAWREGKLYFENQRLQSVVEELGRYTESRIIIEDEALRQLLIGGTFQTTSEGINTLLDMLEEGFGLHVRREEDGRIYIADGARE